jgi:hypothetical protein
MPTDSRTEGNILAPLKTVIKNKTSKLRRLLCSYNNNNNNSIQLFIIYVKVIGKAIPVTGHGGP